VCPVKRKKLGRLTDNIEKVVWSLPKLFDVVMKERRSLAGGYRGTYQSAED
jgi:hypothetical protein